ncbi:Alpha/Beta hydrolase protein [Leptodontidium sp. MPI-SDFR-AT-0119]|nr:Alpha/Beta hydrolase protein [Leptodontidium sp. MPI-SDFR-AT-0119]
MPAYVKQTRSTDILPKGWQKNEKKRPLSCDIIYDQNIVITLKDGTKIYCDVLRPHGVREKIPALVGMSPYGKGGHGFDIYGNCPYRIGIPESKLSGLEKFEFLDPAEWAPRGYAIVNVDLRGTWESDGNLYIEGSQQGRDGYEIVEFIAALDWCNGSIGMAGNSWLATSQWSTAFEQPPSLKAIAPWEGFTDMYREIACRGGIPNLPFLNFIMNKTIRGRRGREDIVKALQTSPLYSPYWEDKNLSTANIKIPMYVAASYSSAIHGFGTVKGYRHAASQKKWLRIHSTQEWYDLYHPDNTDELQKFFDRYLNGVNNDWEKTVPVRVSVLTFHKKALDNRPFSEYPPKNTQYKKLFLSESSLVTAPVDKISSVSYQADDLRAVSADFKLVFDETTTLIGFSKARLWVSCADTDDMDIYLSIRKADKNGKVLEHINLPWEELPDDVKSTEDVPNANYLGATGVLRLSHRAQDPQRSSDIIPFHPHDKEEKVPPGTVVSIEIGFWPLGIQFEAGESLILRAQGSLDQCIEFPDHTKSKPDNLNKGKHTIHFGGKYESSLIIPIVPLN